MDWSKKVYSEQSGKELKLPNFLRRKEDLERLLNLSPEEFLQYFAPHRERMFKRLKKKIEFKFGGKLIVDLTMPMRVGGYFSPGSNIIAINPFLLLHGSENEIAHVLFHEGLHAGAYGPQVLDESLTETLTKKKIQEVYGGSELKSGYDGLVKQANQFFGDLTYKELAKYIEDGDEDTLNNLLELIVVKPLLDKSDLPNWHDVKKKLKTQWQILKRLFPRMMNSIGNKTSDLHEEAKLDFHEYKLEGLLKKTAQKAFEEERVSSLVRKIIKAKKLVSKGEVIKELINQGYSYMYDYNPDIVDSIAHNELLKNPIIEFDTNMHLGHILG